MIIKPFYRRNLPHFQSEYSYYFVTYRLYNSLSKKIVQELKNYYLRNKNSILKINDPGIRSEKLYELHKRYFGKFDYYLDTNKECINYLSLPEIARICAGSMKFWDNIDYELICYSIMPNHVHMLVYVERFLKPFHKTMQSIKRFSSRESNKIINRQGIFWHEENYDHIVRNPKELNNIIKYIMNNPVKAGLVDNADDWKWRYLKEGW